MNTHLEAVVHQFQLEGTLLAVDPVKVGHINDTYVFTVRMQGGAVGRYILQRINQFVFKDPVGLMENIERVTRHLRAKIIAAGGDPERETLNLVAAADGGAFFQDPAGEYWRVFRYIENARTYESVENPQHIYNTAWAFGNFQCQLADFPAEQLHETLPNFHNTPKRFLDFVDALERDPCNRAKGVKDEIGFVVQRKDDASVVVDLLNQGRLPLRVTHNDAKLNNVMIDDQTGKGICIIDLDTVMPGSALYDFGDTVRSTAALAAEDEPDSNRAGISIPVFDQLARGYLDATRAFLLPLEMEYLAFSARLITFEQAIRFLGDYLNGDVYYKISRKNHNLDRARTQIKMVQDMEELYPEMVAIISNYR